MGVFLSILSYWLTKNTSAFSYKLIKVQPHSDIFCTTLLTNNNIQIHAFQFYHYTVKKKGKYRERFQLPILITLNKQSPCNSLQSNLFLFLPSTLLNFCCLNIFPTFWQTLYFHQNCKHKLFGKCKNFWEDAISNTHLFIWKLFSQFSI